MIINTAPTARNQATKPRPKASVAGAKAGTKAGTVEATPANLVSQTLNAPVGATVFDYVAKWRIEAAKPLIAAGEASVLAVALEVGFNARSTFYKAFKRETGMTPHAYRRLQTADPTPGARPSAP